MSSTVSPLAPTRAARHQRIAEVLAHQSVRSQTQLLQLLAQQGLTLTQATLSRDLDEMGAVRVRNGGGPLLYVLPEEGGAHALHMPEEPGDVNARLHRVASQLLVSAQANDNLVIIRTPAGAAQFLASAIDSAQRSDVLGTVAGDDTILLVAAHPHGGQALAQALMALVKRRS